MIPTTIPLTLRLNVHRRDGLPFASSCNDTLRTPYLYQKNSVLNEKQWSLHANFHLIDLKSIAQIIFTNFLLYLMSGMTNGTVLNALRLVMV